MANYYSSEECHLKKEKKTKVIKGESIEDESFNKKVKRKRKGEDYTSKNRMKKKKLEDEEVLEGFEESDEYGKVKMKSKILDLENDGCNKKKKKKETNEVFEEESVEVCYNEQPVDVLKVKKHKKGKRKRITQVEDYQHFSSKSKKKKKLRNEFPEPRFEEIHDEKVKKKRQNRMETENDDHKMKKKKEKLKKKGNDSSSKNESKRNDDISICLEKSFVKKSKQGEKGEKLENKEAFEEQNLPELPILVSGKNEKNQSKEESKLVYECSPIHLTWFPSKEIKEKFKLRQGRWTKAEEKILKENMERYLDANNIDNPSKLIFAYLRNSKTEEDKKWKEFVTTTDFYRKLAKGINRSLFSIYRKVLRNFDKQNCKKTYSESDDKELKRLFYVHGRKWEKIGRIMQRNGKSVQWRFYRLPEEGNLKKGNWSDSEIEMLRKAVRKVTNTSEDIEVFTNINWMKVASIVKTRNCAQCRHKWVYNSCLKDCKLLTEKKWSVLDELKLIKRVYESSVTEEVDVDWYKIYKHFDIGRSPEWLHAKFKIIINKYCGFIAPENRDFENIIDYLYNVKSKELQKFEDEVTSPE